MCTSRPSFNRTITHASSGFLMNEHINQKSIERWLSAIQRSLHFDISRFNHVRERCRGRQWLSACLTPMIPLDNVTSTDNSAPIIVTCFLIALKRFQNAGNELPFWVNRFLLELLFKIKRRYSFFLSKTVIHILNIEYKFYSFKLDFSAFLYNFSRV